MSNSPDYPRLSNLPSLSAGESVGLERGSFFRDDGYISPGADDTKVAAYGEGSPPEIDCSTVADEDAWSPVREKSNTYYQDVSPPDFKGIPDLIQPQAFEDDQEIQYAGSIDNVDVTPGSFHFDTSNTPWKLYYHPTGSTDPRTDDKRMEYAITPLGVNLSGEGIQANNGVIEGLKVRRPLSVRGCIAPGVGGAIKQCLLYDAGKHHTVHPGGLIKDTVFARSTINRGRLSSSAISWFQGRRVSGTYTAEVSRSIFRSMRANPSLTHDANFSDTIIKGGVFYDVPLAGMWPGEQLTVRGGYLYHAGSLPIIASGTGHTYDALMIDGFNTNSAGRGMEKGFTIRNSVILDEFVSRKPESGVQITFENCVLIDKAIRDQAGNDPTLQLKNCVIAALHDEVTKGNFSIDPASDHCVFVSESNGTETRFNGTSRSLRQLQRDTGAFSNSAFLTVDQWNSFLSDWRRGDMRISADATVTHADGTVSNTLPDNTPLTDVGPQKYWDGSTNQLEDGPPSQWPTPPLDEADDTVFIQKEWDWNQKPHTHKQTVALDTRLSAFWGMDGDKGTPESDLEGTNDLDTVGGAPDSGRTSHFPFRHFDGEDDYLQTENPRELQTPSRLWVAFPLRPLSLDKAGLSIFKGMPPGGYGVVTRENSVIMGITIRIAQANSERNANAEFNMSTGTFQIVQMWSDPEKAKIGLRVGSTEIVQNGAYNSVVSTQPGRDLSVGSRPGGGFYFNGDVGPIMISKCVPSRTDREWLHNDGRFRTLSEIRNHEITILEI